MGGRGWRGGPQGGREGDDLQVLDDLVGHAEVEPELARDARDLELRVGD